MKMCALAVAVAAVALGASAQERPVGDIVPVYHEPHHRMVFAAGTTKILDVQVPPGDVSWYHTHTEPILYITLSGSQLRTQVLGEDWGGGAGRGNAGRGAGRGNAPPAAAGPAVRLSSTTSYVEQPVTHRIQNTGERLFRLIAVTNATAGDAGATETGAGFPGTPELTNRWFRAYRFSLAPGESTGSHRHTAPAVLVQTSDGRAVASGPMTWELGEPGRWAWFDGGDAHQIRNVGDTRIEFVEVEVRQPVR